MQIKIGSFGKRHNSTKQPVASWGKTLADVELKEDTSMEEPVFRIGFSNWNSGYNYIYVPSWDRYYFVIDVTVRIGRIWEVACRLDAAGTYRSDIRGSTGLIVYAQKANSEIIDNRIPTKTTATYAKNYATLSQSLMTGQWKIAVSVTGSDSTTTFLLTPAQVRQLVNSTDLDNWFNNIWQQVTSLDGDTDQSQINVTSAISGAGSEIQGATDTLGMLKGLALAANNMSMAVNWCVGDGIRTFIKGMAKTFRKLIATPNAMECIRSAVFIPWDVVGDGSMQNIILGEYDTGIQALPVYNPIQTDMVTVAIPWQATDWRRNAPYHQIYLYLPFMGDVELSPSDLIDCNSINVYFALNVMTGALNYRVATDQDTTIGVYSCQTGVSYPIGASNITPLSVGMGIAGAASAILGAPTLAAAATAAASLSSIKPSVSCVGGGGGGAGSGLDRRIIIHSVYHDTVVEPNVIRTTTGEPYYKVATLNTITGFAQTEKMSVSGLHMSDAVRQEINNMCDNGIYME